MLCHHLVCLHSPRPPLQPVLQHLVQLQVLLWAVPQLLRRAAPHLHLLLGIPAIPAVLAPTLFLASRESSWRQPTRVTLAALPVLWLWEKECALEGWTRSWCYGKVL